MREKRLAQEYFDLSKDYGQAGEHELEEIAFKTHKYFQKLYHDKILTQIKKSA